MSGAAPLSGALVDTLRAKMASVGAHISVTQGEFSFSFFFIELAEELTICRYCSVWFDGDLAGDAYPTSRRLPSKSR